MSRLGLGSRAVAVLMCLVIVAVPLMAQQAQSEYLQGRLEGEAAAKGSPLWFLAGLGCGVFGAGAAYFFKPKPPTHALIGKSAEYVLGYQEGYGDKARKTNTGYACAGWVAFVAAYAAAGGFSAE